MNHINRKIATLLVLFLFSIGAISASEDIVKVLADRKFEVNKNAELVIDHSYGKVTCKNWDENAISVKVIARIENTSPGKAEKIFNRIKISVSGNNNRVEVESSYSGKVFDNGDHNLSVDFEIYMPAAVSLELNHQFGNAYIGTVAGEANIECEYGALEVDVMKGESNNVEVGFGSAKIGYIKGGKLEIQYSSLELEKAGNLKLESEYSSVNIQKVESLKLEHEGGSAKIGKVGTLDLSADFSDVGVDLVEISLAADTEYGNLTVRKISKDFTEIVVENKFGAVDLYLEQGSTFSLEANLEFCSLNYPDDDANFSQRIVSATDSYYSGIIGKGGEAAAKVSIKSQYGSMSILYR